ncbi:hypothetical protein VNO77_42760 [Canavalia gladiata]|uniref:Glabrous enhancer-binding protein-like DBD domain-containing protein n=1 Tax=Canavalia gladiata TaxID=3824 RepID=A0AAN9JTI5_CANGL
MANHAEAEPLHPSNRRTKRRLLDNGDAGTGIPAADDGGESKKRSLFERIWSDEDETAMLKSMAEFTSETGLDPYREATTFHSILKKLDSIRVEISTDWNDDDDGFAEFLNRGIRLIDRSRIAELEKLRNKMRAAETH